MRTIYQSNIVIIKQPVTRSNQLRQVRQHDFNFTRPLLYTRVEDESDRYKNLKTQLELRILQLKETGILTDVSVYVKLLDQGDWMYINNGSVFRPGSMLKIPTAIAFLKMCEKNPLLLNREFIYVNHGTRLLQTFSEKPLISGKKYKAKELLYEMMVHSDNDATNLLTSVLDNNIYNKLFMDMELSRMDLNDFNYTISARDLSKFLRILYNASYLNVENSEYCLSLLAKSSFKNGIVNELPSDIQVVHKFGEGGFPGDEQLHETGIVYNDNKPYLITIMTRGKIPEKLAKVISEISKMVFNELKTSG